MPPVVLIMIDGLRPDALTQAKTPRLDAFIAAGAHTLNARSVMPSVTLPCHTSIFHSVPPQRHGILDNVWHSMARPVQGLVEVAHNADRRTGFFHNWEPLRDLNRPEMLDFSHFTNTSTLVDGDVGTAEAVASYWRKADLDFTFVYFGVTDTAGHVYGWMSDGYIEQIERTDPLVGMVLDTVMPDATVIIHADHGGHERNHGTEMPEDMTIPWMIGGKGIKHGHVIQQQVTLLDTAPTAAHLLGLTPPKDWEGTPVLEALEEYSAKC